MSYDLDDVQLEFFYGVIELPAMLIGIMLCLRYRADGLQNRAWHYLAVACLVTAAAMHFAIFRDDGPLNAKVRGYELMIPANTFATGVAIFALRGQLPGGRYLSWLLGPIGRMPMSAYVLGTLVLTMASGYTRNRSGWGTHALYQTPTEQQAFYVALVAMLVVLVVAHVYQALKWRGPIESAWRWLSFDWIGRGKPLTER